MLGLELEILQGILRDEGGREDFFLNWKFSCKLTNLSGDEIPGSPGAGQWQGRKKTQDHLGGGGCGSDCPVVLLQLAQHRENSSELKKNSSVLKKQDPGRGSRSTAWGLSGKEILPFGF